MNAPEPSRPRFAPLDGLRGLAVLLVVLGHCYLIVPTPDGATAHEAIKRLLSLTFAGVDIFFVLSGFLLGGILLDHRDSSGTTFAFYVRRFFRIVPLYALLLATFFVAREIPWLAAQSGGQYFASPVALWTYPAMLQNIGMATAHDVGPYWLTPTWSLGIEEQFYLILPFLVRRVSRRGLVAICLGAAAMAPALRFATLLYSGNTIAAIYLLPMRADSLLCGVLCAVAVRSPTFVALFARWRAAVAGLGLGLAAMLLVFTSARMTAWAPSIVSFGYTLFALGSALLVLECVLNPSGRLARWLSFRPLCGLGVISYFVYLFHQPVHFTLHAAWLGQPPLHANARGGLVTLAAVALTLLLAAASWRWLESPLLRLGRRFSYGPETRRETSARPVSAIPSSGYENSPSRSH